VPRPQGPSRGTTNIVGYFSVGCVPPGWFPFSAGVYFSFRHPHDSFPLTKLTPSGPWDQPKFLKWIVWRGAFDWCCSPVPDNYIATSSKIIQPNTHDTLLITPPFVGGGGKQLITPPATQNTDPFPLSTQ